MSFAISSGGLLFFSRRLNLLSRTEFVICPTARVGLTALLQRSQCCTPVPRHLERDRHSIHHIGLDMAYIVAPRVACLVLSAAGVSETGASTALHWPLRSLIVGCLQGHADVKMV